MEAIDGRIGTVVDFLFDDTSWKVRWLVVDCGNWLEGRKVLIHPLAVSHAGLEGEQFQVKLTKAQVEGSPTLLEHQPVSQQMQSRLYDYYAWDSAWSAPYFGVTGGMAPPMMAPPYFGLETRAEARSEVVDSEERDPHLRSVVEVIGYHIHATDGDIGHVENFMLDCEGWNLRIFRRRYEQLVAGQARAGRHAGGEGRGLVRPACPPRCLPRTSQDEPALGSDGRVRRNRKDASPSALWLGRCRGPSAIRSRSDLVHRQSLDRGRTRASMSNCGPGVGKERFAELAHPHGENREARKRDWRHIHHSPLFWIGVAMFLTAILTHVFSEELSLRPRLHAPARAKERIHRPVL